MPDSKNKALLAWVIQTMLLAEKDLSENLSGPSKGIMGANPSDFKKSVLIA